MSFLYVENLKKYFPVKRGFWAKRVNIYAVDGITFEVQQGQIFSIVGESGCGKTTCAKLLLRLLMPTEGSVYFQNRDIFKLRGRDLHNFRKQVQIVFQNPYMSLNPRKLVGKLIAEALHIHHLPSSYDRIVRLLKLVQLPEDAAGKFAHQLSGGERQRVVLARALACQPTLLVLDEPIALLDVLVGAKILELLLDLKSQFNLTYIYISHDLRVVGRISEWVGVMYLGTFLELGETGKIYTSPKHPYTVALFKSIPQVGKRTFEILPGEPRLTVGDGCRFFDRCHETMDKCKITQPPLKAINTKHYVACHLF